MVTALGEASPSSLLVDHLWKVFGDSPGKAIEMADKGLSRSEILAATGCTVGVRDISFDVSPGETFVVMGLSGSGKSTLIRCAARLIEPTKGRVIIDGADLLTMSDDDLRQVRRNKLSMVFQHFGLFPHRRVIDNVAFGLEVQGMSKSERHERAEAVIKVVGLEGWETHYPQQLSGGMQQRVGLARALALHPQVLFFDEPFSALDPLIRRDMQDELIRLQAELHCTIVFITHDFAEALKLGDRIAIMKDGAFDQIGTPVEIVTKPATDYVREFTKDVPKAKVITASAVIDAGVVAAPNAPRLHMNTPVEQLVPHLLHSGDAVAIFDDAGRILGAVDRESVARVLTEG
jgi:glycine betaine/proline transport system ATP-binding protein